MSLLLPADGVANRDGILILSIYVFVQRIAGVFIPQRLCYVLTHEEDSERLGGSFDESTKA